MSKQINKTFFDSAIKVPSGKCLAFNILEMRKAERKLMSEVLSKNEDNPSKESKRKKITKVRNQWYKNKRLKKPKSVLFQKEKQAMNHNSGWRETLRQKIVEWVWGCYHG